MKIFPLHFLGLILPMVVQGAALDDESPWGANIEMNVGYNDNVYLASDDYQTVALGSAVQNEDVQNQLLIGADYKFLSRRSSDMKLLVDYFQEHLVDNQIDTTIGSVTSPFTYYGEQMRLRIAPAFSRYNLSGDAILATYGMTADATRKLGRYQLGLNYGFSRKSALMESYAAYAGRSDDLHIYFSGYWPGRSFTIKAGRYMNDYQETLLGDESYGGLYVSSNAAWRFGSAAVSVYARVKSKDYVSDSYNGIDRFDVNSYLSLTPSYALTRNMEAFLLAEWTDNRSNFDSGTDNMNYTQRVVSLGMRYGF